jgi:hypothetical protein
MPKISSSFDKPRSSPRKSLETFDHAVQQYGAFFAAYAWQAYCTGTFRTEQGLVAAERRFQRFINMAERKLKSPLGFVAVPDRTTSGLGKSGPWHWHFLLCGPPHLEAELLMLAKKLWEWLNGNAHVLPYDRDLNGAHYLAKKAGEEHFDYWIKIPDCMKRTAFPDFFLQQQSDPYVPNHVRDKLFGETLVLRPRTT